MPISDLQSPVMTDFRMEGLVRAGGDGVSSPYGRFSGGYLIGNDVITAGLLAGGQGILQLSVIDSGAAEHTYTASVNIATWWNANAVTGNQTGDNSYLPFEYGKTDFYWAVAFDAVDTGVSKAYFYAKQFPWDAWSQVGTTQTGTTFTQATPAANWEIAEGETLASGTTYLQWEGRVYWGKVYDDFLGTSLILNPDFSDQATLGEWGGGSPANDSTGNAWTSSGGSLGGWSAGRYFSSLFGYMQGDNVTQLGNLDTQLSDNADVGVTTPTNKNVLVADGDSWESRSVGLTDLSDTGVVTPTNKNAMMGDGDSWESRALVEADISNLHTPPPVAITNFIPSPAKTSVSNMHGDIVSITTGVALDSVPTNIVASVGIGKVMVVVNAGSDVAGDITITGTSVDRETGAETPSDTDTLTVDTVSTDGTTTDANGVTIWSLSDAYMSAKWFTGSITLSTTNLTLTDVDVYTVAFEQWNDTAAFEIDTLDITCYTTNVAAELDAYLFTVKPTGDKVIVASVADVHVGAVGTAAVANRGYRLRRGNLGVSMAGATDGLFLSVTFANSPAYVLDVTTKIWCTST